MYSLRRITRWLAALAVAIVVTSPTLAQKRPNIVILMSDDTG